MKKIYAFKERILCIFLLSILITVHILFIIINAVANYELLFLMILVDSTIVGLFAKLFIIPCRIVIDTHLNRIKVSDLPFFATNRFYIKKRSLILWNSEINIDEVENAELVVLTKNYKQKYIGYVHLGNRYVKVKLKNSKSVKYIYVSIYSNSQIRELLNLLNKK